MENFKLDQQKFQQPQNIELKHKQHILRQIYRKQFIKALSESNYSKIKELAANPNLHGSLLVEIFKRFKCDNSQEVIEIMQKLAQNPSSPADSTLLFSPDLFLEYTDLVIINPTIRNVPILNLNLAYAIHFMIVDKFGIKDFENRVERMEKPEIIEILYTISKSIIFESQEESNRLIIESVKKSMQAMCDSIALNLNTQVNILIDIVSNDRKVVCTNALKNPNLPVEVMLEIVNRYEEGQRYGFENQEIQNQITEQVRVLISTNPSLPHSILEQYINHNVVYIRGAVAASLNLNKEDFLYLVENEKHDYVLGELFYNKSFKKNILEEIILKTSNIAIRKKAQNAIRRLDN